MIKKLLFPLLCSLCLLSAFAQSNGVAGVAIMHTTVNFSDILALIDTQTTQVLINEPEEEHNIPFKINFPMRVDSSSINTSFGPVINQPQANSPAPTTDFDGLGDANTSIPPDVNGCAGNNELMVTLNTQVRIESKTGTTTSTVTLNSFFSSLGSPSVFDPKILFDPVDDRYIFVACGNAQSSSSCILIAVTQTDNPSGTWNMWKVDVDGTNTNWFDFPSLGFNKNWIVVTGNMFTNASNSWSYGQAYAFRKSDLYANGTGLYTLFNNNTNIFTLCPSVTYDSTSHNMFLVQTVSGNWGSNGVVELWKLSGAVGSESLSAITYISTTQRWAGDGGVSNFAPQNGTTNKFDTGDDRMRNVVRRNNKLWFTHTVFLPYNSPSRSSIMWWQTDTTGTVAMRSMIDDSLAGKFFAYPTIAVNKNEDVLLGYCRFKSTEYAGANYSFRTTCDATNTFETDTQYHAGTAQYFKTFSGSTNRWGDYSNTVVDPSNDLDLWTLQEYASNPVSSVSRWAVRWAKLARSAGGGAGTWTWTGTVSTNWFAACNWDQNSVPNSLSDVVIPSGTTFLPTITGGAAFCNTLSVASTTSTLVTVNSSGGGSLTITQ